MSLQTADTAEESEEHGGHEVHEHPSDRTYIKIALILAVITAAEVSVYFLEDSVSTRILYPALIVMMVAKFFIVGAYFMHLKYDSPLFRRVFIAGLVLAGAVYLVTLSAFVFWQDSGTDEFDDPPQYLDNPAVDENGIGSPLSEAVPEGAE